MHKSTKSNAAAIMSHLPQPHAIIAWHTLSLLSSLQEERLILDKQHRRDLAALLADAAKSLHQSSQRLALPPHAAESLRALQHLTPTTLNN